MSNNRPKKASNRSEEGYDVQRRETQRILDETKRMKSVTHTDSRGRPIRSGADVKKGADGGIDLVTDVTTKNEASATRVQNRILKKYRASRERDKNG